MLILTFVVNIPINHFPINLANISMITNSNIYGNGFVIPATSPVIVVQTNHVFALSYFDVGVFKLLNIILGV